MKNIEIKLILDPKSEINSLTKIVEAIDAFLAEPMNYRTLKIGTQESGLDALKGYLEEKYECSVRDGVTGGCYGARDGSQFKGLTVWMHPKELVDRYIQTDSDGEKTEFVNPWYLLTENATLVEDLDGEAFDTWAEALGVEYKSDNTYNFGTDFGSLRSEHAAFMFDFQFSTIELENGGALVSIMFHCGGDPRGNYTTKHVFKFNYLDDFYSVIFPGLCLLTEESEESAG